MLDQFGQTLVVLIVVPTVICVSCELLNWYMRRRHRQHTELLRIETTLAGYEEDYEAEESKPCATCGHDYTTHYSSPNLGCIVPVYDNCGCSSKCTCQTYA